MDEVPPFELFPGSGRVATRLTSLLRRIPGLAWPFIALAALDLVVFGLAAGGRWSPWEILTAVITVAWALLPAAVIVGCPTAWRSARLVLIGAIGWSTIGASATLVWGSSMLSTGMTTQSYEASLALSAIREIASLAAPILIVVGLSSRRRTETSWPAPVVILGVAGTALALLYVGPNAWSYYNDSPWTLDPLTQKLQLVSQLLGPLVVPVGGALAWSSLSALRAGEQPRRFWLALTGGSAALLAGYAISLVTAWGFGAIGFSEGLAELYVSVSNVVNGLSSVAIVLLLLAFALGLPSEQFDLGDPTEAGGNPAVSAVPTGEQADASA